MASSPPIKVKEAVISHFRQPGLKRCSGFGTSGSIVRVLASAFDFSPEPDRFGKTDRPAPMGKLGQSGGLDVKILACARRSCIPHPGGAGNCTG